VRGGRDERCVPRHYTCRVMAHLGGRQAPPGPLRWGDDKTRVDSCYHLRYFVTTRPNPGFLDILSAGDSANSVTPLGDADVSLIFSGNCSGELGCRLRQLGTAVPSSPTNHNKAEEHGRSKKSFGPN